MIHYYAECLLGLQIFLILMKIYNFDFEYGFRGIESNIFNLAIMLPLYGVALGWW